MHTALAVALSSLFLAASARAAPGPELSDFTAGEPVQAYNIALIPLETKSAPPYDDYTVLEEATAAKKIRIQEKQGGGEVSELTVKNADTRPLYLLGGEIVLGGQQDRMLQTDRVLAPGESTAVAVRCVEHGRWDGADLTFRSSGELAHASLRRAAAFGDQGDVWQEVARKSAATGVHSATGTYRRVLQDESARRRIKAYVDELAAKLPKSERLTGVAVAINGDLELVDVFDSPALFAKLERKLLSSYVLTALERQPAPEREVKAKLEAMKKPGTVSDFMAKSAGKKGGVVFKSRGKAVHGTFFGTEGTAASK